MAETLPTVINHLDSIKRSPGKENEHWMARELAAVLEYADWRNFEGVIEKARNSMRGMGVDPSNQVVETTTLIKHGKGAKREAKDYFLSRYACYLIAMNGDSAKTVIATAQSYFAVQTRRMELEDEKMATERRIEMRSKVRDANKELGSAAKQAGVRNQSFGIFHDAGYRGLYNMPLREIREKKGIGKDDLLDRSGHAELAANYFRITQTEQKLSRERIQGERAAIDTHREVGAEVRSTIDRLGGTPPEKLEPEPSIKKLEREQKRKNLPKK